MKTVRLRSILLLVVVSLFTTGCWNRLELNEQALVMASGVDATDDGKLLLTDQVILPTNLSKGQSTMRQKFITVSATGRNIMEAGQNLQTKLSRKYFLGHRRIIFVGEKLSQHGLGNIMDQFLRNPDARLRSDLFVVKNDTAVHALQIPSPLEQYPSLAVIKSRKFVGGTSETTLLSFLMEYVSPTSSPTLPVVEIVPESPDSNDKTFSFSGRAIFNKQLKLVGYLNYSEASYRFWIMNTVTNRQVTFEVGNGNGLSTIDCSQFKSSIRPIVNNGHLRYVITLGAQGLLRESETDLKLKTPKELNLLERSAEQEVTQKVSHLISTVQHEYGTDIFGFDRAVARKYPRQWEGMKNHWDEIFPDIPVQIKAHITIKVVGLTSESVAAPKQTVRRGW